MIGFRSKCSHNSRMYVFHIPVQKVQWPFTNAQKKKTKRAWENERRIEWIRDTFPLSKIQSHATLIYSKIRKIKRWVWSESKSAWNLSTYYSNLMGFSHQYRSHFQYSPNGFEEKNIINEIISSSSSSSSLTSLCIEHDIKLQ